MTTPEQSTAATAPAAASQSSLNTKPQRVLACVLCQQRKVKCDRKFPCVSCVRSGVQCVPAATLAPRPRRRRFPERELLDRLRRYESLLTQNNIAFDSHHTSLSPTHEQPRSLLSDDGNDSPHAQPTIVSGPGRSSSSSVHGKPEPPFEAKDFWNAVKQRSRNDEDESSSSSPDTAHDAAIRSHWEQAYRPGSDLLFGLHKTVVDLSALHPEPGQTFRLWQIYLDNVNPLLKITHTPTLQGRVIEATSNLESIQPSLAALMFSIYCVSVMSLAEDECLNMFGSPREELLSKHQLNCQRALLNCGFLRSNDRECLVALFLYLISLAHSTDPQSLSAIFSLAIHIAQCIGIHSEAANTKCSPLEAELRRRLWWSIVLFDTRIRELGNYKSAALIPIWDCKTPLNINDFDLQPEMKEPPTSHGRTTEALFAVVRAEMGDFIRHTASYLNFTNPALKAIAKDLQRGSNLNDDESMIQILKNHIEDRYLQFCNPENPFHFMTMLTARSYLAKHQLMEFYTKSTAQQTDVEAETALEHALNLLYYDTKLLKSPSAKAYNWFTRLHFPFPAYIHICQSLKKRPNNNRSEQIWDAMSDNYEARFIVKVDKNDPFFKILAKLPLQAWEVQEALFKQSGQAITPPRMITDIKNKMAQPTRDIQSNEQLDDPWDMNIDDFTATSMPIDLGGQGMLFGIGSQGYQGPGFAQGSPMTGIGMTPLSWNAMVWPQMHNRFW